MPSTMSSSRFHETAECTSSDSTRVACTFAIVGFEREHATGASSRVRETRQLKHRRDMRLVLLPQLDHMRCCGEIVVAIRHSETALEQIWEAVRRIRQALGDPHSEEVPGLEIGVVQRIDICAELPAQHAGQTVAIRDGCDPSSCGFSGAIPFDSMAASSMKLE